MIIFNLRQFWIVADFLHLTDKILPLAENLFTKNEIYDIISSENTRGGKQ